MSDAEVNSVTGQPLVPPLYWEVREASNGLFHKVLQDARTANVSMLKAAKILGVRTAGKTIVFRDRADQIALVDYFLHDYMVDGQTLLQKVNATDLNLTPPEAVALESSRQARTSLFRLAESVVERCQIRLVDVLEPDTPEFVVTDLVLSQLYSHWAARGLVFCRLIKAQDFTMTSGFYFHFALEKGQAILQALFQKLKNKSEDDWPELKFQFFFQMHHRYGLPVQYPELADVPARQGEQKTG